MQSGIYVGLSGQVALQRQLDTIANNVANVSTAGFRGGQVKFDSLRSGATAEPTSYASSRAAFINRNAGEVVQTGNMLDVAVHGEAWLAIDTPAGRVYTRDGRLQMRDTGALETLAGNPVIDAGGAPILLDPTLGRAEIAADGMISQGGRQTAALGLFSIADGAKLDRYENSGVIPDIPASPVIDFTRAGVLQGYVEGANVNPIAETTHLITVQRTFDALTTALNETEASLQEAIRTLGSVT
jgi:flagellar basal-body rod protein FlgF